MNVSKTRKPEATMSSEIAQSIGKGYFQLGKILHIPIQAPNYRHGYCRIELK